MYMDFTEKWLEDDSVWSSTESQKTTLSLWQLFWGFENIFTIRAAAQISHQDPELGGSKTATGMGDFIIDAKYNFYNPGRELGYAGVIYPEFSAVVGVRAPSGASTDTPVPLSHWLGAGSTDLEVGGLVRLGNHIGALHAMIGHWLNGLLGEERQDETFYNVTLEGPRLFNKNFLIFLVELDGSTLGHEYCTQICPGVEYIITYGRGVEIKRKIEHAIALQASFPIPINTRGGYRYKYAPFVGVSWTF
jgi:hypothetical protein